MLDYRSLLREARKVRFESGLTPLPEVELDELRVSEASGRVIREPSADQRHCLFEDGLRELSKGGYALLILSGGLATRVGITFPKALLPISPVRRKTLLQLHLEKVNRLCALLGKDSVPPRVFILTSPFNHDSIEGYLESQRFFGLDKRQVVLVMQGTAPCLTLDGNDFFPCPPAEDGSDSKVVEAPKGNGALFEALAHCPEFMSQLENLRLLHVIAIDNALSRPLDPELVGLALRCPGVEVLNKCVVRRGSEKVGVFCMGKAPRVVEYSELEMLPDASFLQGTTRVYGNMCDHAFSGEFLRRIIEEQLFKQLPYHAANKVVSYYDQDEGRMVRPDAPNGYTLELFVFDVFQFASRVMCIEVDRDSQFAPVKNVADYNVYNELSAQHRISRQSRNWLEAAGAELGEGFFEVSCLASYQGEGLERYRGARLEGPMYIE
ncbi:hypothetical protein, conserved [Babesia bigemina]|uniref:UDP-N-acetylglucosamine diphosphorylase n=1 Tax=Babesia bigemina TaxID=5866 RepID=A0A061D9N2_BABBI|nr:hypothetical protein, conserved [Babesia bigemina]CDR95629.1 hypothetical protein, conserved [Babesia bigemina]|eukprot:XP_012767815.1 hypothetical protein, conserved [Babesia bigemina]